MRKAEIIFYQIADQLSNATKSKVFGALCIKATNGKSAAILWKDSMMFKLNEEDRKKALNLRGAREGTHLYAPNRPMKGWVIIPLAYSSRWKGFAKKSLEYIVK